ncbi:hypothetical protein NXY01_20695 [Bacteroides fragilis]|nr:hypothetical protein NXY01_20695 [Bacteroides fragilis]
MNGNRCGTDGSLKRGQCYNIHQSMSASMAVTVRKISVARR